MPRRPDLSLEEQKKIVHELERDVQEDLNDRSDWLQRRVNSIEDWLVPDVGTVNYPWEDSSNITPPIIAKAVRTVYPRITNAFFGSDPFVHVTPVDPGLNTEDSEAREGFLNYVVRNEIPDFYRETSTWFLDALVHGTGALMIWWEQSSELVPIWKIVDAEVPNPISPQETIRLTDRMILDNEFASVDPQTGEVLRDFTAAALGDHSYNVKYERDGYPQEHRVTIDRNDAGLRSGQASLTIEETRHTGRCRVRTISIEDVIAPASATGVQPEQAHHVFRPYWQYPKDIEARMDEGEFPNLTSEDLQKLEQLVTGDPLAKNRSEEVKETMDAVQGIDSVSGLSGFERDMVRVVECYYPWRVNGQMVQMIFHWIPALKKLAGWEYLSVKFRHGRRPLVLLPFLALSNRMYGLGLADLLANVQMEAKIIFNQMNNREDLINNPVMLVEQNAGVNPNVFKQLPPGSTVTVRNVERVRPLEWAKDPHSGLPILQNLFAFGEQLAGVGDIQAGVQPNRPNAPRTARGTLALISEGNIILDQHIKSAQWAISEVIFQIDSLYYQYGPEEMPFTLTGKREVNLIRKEQLGHSVKYFFTGNTVNTNAQQQQGVAEFLYQNLVQLPFFTGQYLYMPDTSIVALYRLVDYFTKQHLPGKDASYILPELQKLRSTAAQFLASQAEEMRAQREDLTASADDAQDREFDIEEAKAAAGLLKVFTDSQAKQGELRTRLLEMQQRGAGNGEGSSPA